jgi:hypothetical protein
VRVYSKLVKMIIGEQICTAPSFISVKQPSVRIMRLEKGTFCNTLVTLGINLIEMHTLDVPVSLTLEHRLIMVQGRRCKSCRWG